MAQPEFSIIGGGMRRSIFSLPRAVHHPPVMSERFRYDEPGTLPRPGPMGRVTRFIFGTVCVWVVLTILTNASAFFTGSSLYDVGVWLMSLWGLYVFPDVVNIGFSKAWKRFHLLTGLIVLAGVAALASWATFGSVVGPPLGIFVALWLLYTFGHLGIAFLLAALLATPGCEMRSIPQLWGLVTGKSAKEHYCPGVLTPIDRWEAKLRASRQGS